MVDKIDIAKLPEENKIRSVIFHFQGDGDHTFEGDVLKPYSFELVNLGTANLRIDKKQVLGGVSAGNRLTCLSFPAIGTFKRNDIINFDFEGAGTRIAYIRADMELVY